MAYIEKYGLFAEMHKQQQAGENVDFMIKSGDQKVLVHALVLGCSSRYLKSLLQPSCVCNCDTPSTLILPFQFSSILAHFVTMLYTGSSNIISNDDVSKLKNLSDELGFSVNSATETGNENNIDDHHVTQILGAAENMSACLKVKTRIDTLDPKGSFELSFPKSRHDRKFSNCKPVERFNSFQGRIQKEYNTCPVGEYVGPYDQNETLNLSVQLPQSNLDFENYSEFVHPQSVLCMKMSISKNYKDISDLDKIDAIEKSKEDEEEEEKSSGDEEDKIERVVYTCTKKECKIPCPCSLCVSGGKQCKLHKVQHSKLFDEKKHAIAIRSSEEFCVDKSFFSSSYVVRYSEIPTNCPQCQKDLLHHKAYHIAFHYSCKFCLQNFFKLRAKNKSDLEEHTKKEENYMTTVCPYCNKKFCEPYFARKHIEFEHGTGTSPFFCEICKQSYHSKQALKYHIDSKHTPSLSSKCSICQKTFKSTITLNNHVKYVHSDERKHACKDCDSKFKQKKHLREHYLRVHGINQYREKYHHEEEDENLPCGHCPSIFE